MLTATARLFLVIGGLTGLVGVALGAFGAHALKTRLAPESLAVWQTAVQYQFWHAGALIAVGLLAIHLPDSAPLRWAGSLMMVGIVLFCGSLYLLAVTGTRWLGALTPLGGVAWLLAWGLFVAAAVRAG